MNTNRSLLTLKEKLDKLELQVHQLKLLLNHYKNPPKRLPDDTSELDLWWYKETNK